MTINKNTSNRSSLEKYERRLIRNGYDGNGSNAKWQRLIKQFVQNIKYKRRMVNLTVAGLLFQNNELVWQEKSNGSKRLT